MNPLTSGSYVATPHVPNTWDIELSGIHVGQLWFHDRFTGRSLTAHFSIRSLVWSGPFPEGYPKNPDAALCFDGGPFETPQEALDKFAAQADALIAWRKRFLETP